MTIVCAMVVGAGEGDRYLNRMLDRAGAWADHIVIVKDHVDEHTEDVIDMAAASMSVQPDSRRARIWHYGIADPTITFRTDESMVRNVLLEALDSLPFVHPGDLIVILDADEELRAIVGTVRTALTSLQDDVLHGAWSIPFFHLWDQRGSYFRVDGGWRPHNQFRIYRHLHGSRIEKRELACTAIPEGPGPRRAGEDSGLLVAHWGYANHADRIAKHALYMRIDGGRFHSRAHLESIVGTPTLSPF